MKDIDFYSLPRSIQDRLLTSFRAEFEPKPLLFQPGPRPVVLLWLGLTVAAVIVMVTVYVVGLGDMDSALARHPTALAVLYVLLAAAFAFGIGEAIAFNYRNRRMHFVPGLYLLPASLIDARDQRFRVHPLGEVSSFAASGSSIVMKFGTRSFSFRVQVGEEQRALQLIKTAVERVRGELTEDQLRDLDPLEKLLVDSPLASTVPLVRHHPMWLRLRWLIVGAVGLVGVLLFSTRDNMSDARMFAEARSRDDVDIYKLYLERGDDHRDEVTKELLPRAELRLAVAKGTVEAIDVFMREYPETGIQKEVDIARRNAMVAAFEKARAAGTLGELLTFTERYPKHGLDEHVNSAKHAIYKRALGSYQARKPQKDTGSAAFVDRLMAFAEKAGATKTAAGVVGPTVEIRFRRVPSKAMRKADELVQRNPYYIGKPSLPSRYLSQEHLDPHEQRLAKAVSKQLSGIFPSDVMVFAQGKALDGKNKKMPSVTVPTLVVSYRLEPSGANYAYKKPRGVYIGLVFFFHLDFLLPQDGEAWRKKHTFAEKIPVAIIREFNDASPRGSVETALYAAMLRSGFAEVQKRYLKDWFAPEP